MIDDACSRRKFLKKFAMLSIGALMLSVTAIGCPGTYDEELPSVIGMYFNDADMQKVELRGNDNVPAHTQFEFVFSTDMNTQLPSSGTQITFVTFVDSNSNPIDFTIGWIDTRTLSVIPSADLLVNTDYIITVNKAEDSAGNPLNPYASASAAFGCGHNDHPIPDHPISVTEFHVPDSGQTQSYTSSFGQDSDYLLHPPSYSDNGNGTITDNVTGLMWQKGYNGSAHLDVEADDYCAGLTLAGLSDWRPPSDFELMTIVDYGTAVPAINVTYFPNTRSDHWWTLTLGRSSTFFISRWAVDFETGNLATPSFFSTGYTRCVRGGQNQPRVFEDNRNGTITDRITGLVWQKQDEGATGAWETAIMVCELLSLGGYTDWRLPNVKELRSIVDSGTYAPAIYAGYFPNTQSDSYWSSTTYVASPDAAWRVNFWHGEVASSLKGNHFFVRCVRGGE